MSGPLAFMLTWSGYGTRLHGDERGTVDSAHNRVGDPYVPANLGHVESIESRLAESPFTMNIGARATVERAIRDDCAHRGWRLLAIHVGRTHVHVVVGAYGLAPEQMIQHLKSWATRRLRESGLFGARRRFWTNQGSTRWLWNDDDIAESVGYVLHDQ